MKATHGLVPYTGVMPIEATIDHTGPMTANVKDNALLLEVLAGPDGLDPRQYSPKIANYTEALKKGVKDLKIGLLKEGFALNNMESKVSESVRQGAQRLAKLGAKIEEISIPEHSLAAALWDPIGIEGLHWQMMLGNGMGMNWKGLYDVPLIDKHAGWRQRADELPHTVKVCMLLGQYFIDKYNGRYYAKAQNIRRRVKEAYDEKFKTCDLLLMPTLPNVATKLPDADTSVADYWTLSLGMLGNTAPFDVSGHPAMSIPCGMAEGLPIGMMLVGQDYGESTIYQAAAEFESDGDWTKF
jgi:amidase